MSEPSNVQAKARTYLEKSIFQQSVKPLGSGFPAPHHNMPSNNNISPAMQPCVPSHGFKNRTSVASMRRLQNSRVFPYFLFLGVFAVAVADESLKEDSSRTLKPSGCSVVFGTAKPVPFRRRVLHSLYPGHVFKTWAFAAGKNPGLKRETWATHFLGIYFFQRFASSYIALTSVRRRMFSAAESPRITSSNWAASR